MDSDECCGCTMALCCGVCIILDLLSLWRGVKLRKLLVKQEVLWRGVKPRNPCFLLPWNEPRDKKEADRRLD